MQSFNDNTLIPARIKAIGLRQKDLARLAGVAPSTILRIASSVACGRVTTLRKILAALETEERRVARHLAELGVHAAPPLAGTALEAGDEP